MFRFRSVFSGFLLASSLLAGVTCTTMNVRAEDVGINEEDVGIVIHDELSDEINNDIIREFGDNVCIGESLSLPGAGENKIMYSDFLANSKFSRSIYNGNIRYFSHDGKQYYIKEVRKGSQDKDDYYNVGWESRIYPASGNWIENGQISHIWSFGLEHRRLYTPDRGIKLIVNSWARQHFNWNRGIYEGQPLPTDKNYTYSYYQNGDVSKYHGEFRVKYAINGKSYKTQKRRIYYPLKYPPYHIVTHAVGSLHATVHPNSYFLDKYLDNGSNDFTTRYSSDLDYINVSDLDPNGFKNLNTDISFKSGNNIVSTINNNVNTISVHYDTSATYSVQLSHEVNYENAGVADSEGRHWHKDESYICKLTNPVSSAYYWIDDNSANTTNSNGKSVITKELTIKETGGSFDIPISNNDRDFTTKYLHVVLNRVSNPNHKVSTVIKLEPITVKYFDINEFYEKIDDKGTISTNVDGNTNANNFVDQVPNGDYPNGRSNIIPLPRLWDTLTNYTFDGWYLGYTSIGHGPTNDKYSYTGSGYGSNVPLSNIPNVKNYVRNGVLTLYAKWKPKQYNIVYHSNVPSHASSKYVTFNGKNTTSDVVYQFTMPYNYDYNLSVNGNSTIIKNLVNNNSATLTHTKTGYTFGGWTTDEFGYNRHSGTSMMRQGGIHLYAKWIPNTYNLTYRTNNPNELNNITGVTDGHKISGLYDYKWSNYSFINASNVKKPGYTAKAWMTNQNGTGTEVTSNSLVWGDTTVWMKWIPNTYRVYLYAGLPSTARDKTIIFENTVKTDTIGNRSVTYDSNYSSVVPADSKNNTRYGVYKYGYTFNGWYTQRDFGGVKVSSSHVVRITGDINLFGRWTPKDVTLVYDLNNPNETNDFGNVSATSITRKFDDVWSGLMQPTKVGYVFMGWNDKADGTGKTYTSDTIVDFEGSKTVYAQWKPITYTIVFHGNKENGFGFATGSTTSLTGGVANMTVQYDNHLTARLTYPANGFTKKITIPGETEGAAFIEKVSQFMGWNRDNANHSASFMPGTVIGNLTTKDKDVVNIYAIWDDTPGFIIEEFPDRYFTISEAISGIITEEELLRTVVAKDRESGGTGNYMEHKTKEDVKASGNDIGITIVGYNPEEFTSISDDTVVSIRYKVKDKAGNEAFLDISVFVSRNESFAKEKVEYYRSIDESYVEKPAEDGGLVENSSWKTNEDYKQVLEQAVASDTSSSASVYQIDLDSTQLEGVRNYILSYGLGNANDKNALSRLYNYLNE